MWTGRAFQEAGPACENARSPNFVVRTVLYFKKTQQRRFTFLLALILLVTAIGASIIAFRHWRFRLPLAVAEWLACWTQAQKGPCSNRSRDDVG